MIVDSGICHLLISSMYESQSLFCFLFIDAASNSFSPSIPRNSRIYRNSLEFTYMIIEVFLYYKVLLQPSVNVFFCQ